MLAKQGRLVLIQSVISAKPVHHMLVMDAPVWLTEAVDKWLRAFLWAGKTEVNGGQCLVAWAQICKPKCFGGLGIKNLRLQGLALRSRWEWLKRTDSDRPWQGLPMIKDDRTKNIFRCFARITLGDGNSVLFWSDRWINGSSVGDVAPLVLQAVHTRQRNHRTVAQGLLQNRWILDISDNLQAEGRAQCVRLWVAVNNVQLLGDRPDEFSWLGSVTGQYSAKGTYELLCQGSIRSATAICIWNSGAPLKCKFFMWLALQYRVWTSDRRIRHGLQDDMVSCYTCLQEEDTLDHILMGCVVAREVWFRCSRQIGFQIQIPDGDTNLEAWWLAVRSNCLKKDRKKLDAFVTLVCWSLWKQRNARVFNNVALILSPQELTTCIVDEFRLWCEIGVGVSRQIVRD
jgi:hypothetical protein